MKRNRLVSILALVTLFVLAAGMFTTRNSASSKHDFLHLTGSDTLFIAPDHEEVSWRPTFISIGETASGTLASFYISGQDVNGGTDTLTLGNGLGYEGYYPHGLDSVRYAAGDADYSIEVSN